MKHEHTPKDRTGAHAKREPRGCSALFFVSFLICGSTFLYLGTIRGITLFLSALDWQTVHCTIVSSEVKPIHDGYTVEITYRYELGGEQFRGDRYSFANFRTGDYQANMAIVNRYPPESEHPCYVAPSHPSRSALDLNVTTDILVGLVGLVFVLPGVIGLLRIFRLSRTLPKQADRMPAKANTIQHEETARCRRLRNNHYGWLTSSRMPGPWKLQ